MMSAEDVRRITGRFEEEILGPKITEFGPRLEALRSGTLEAFQEEFILLVRGTRGELRRLLELPFSKALPSELDLMFCGRIVHACNNMLSSDHPFLVVIINLADEQQYCFGCVERPSIRDLCPDLSPGAIPIVSADSMEHFHGGIFTKVEVVSRPDNLRVGLPEA